MKRKNATRNALFTSIISMLLCVSMLVGTTFAWFTDEVVSGHNTIAAGNLDIELYHSNAKVTDESVKAVTDMFLDLNGEKILWEPGVVAYENLEIANVGSLALKYQLTLNIFNENDLNGHKLSEVLKVAILEDTEIAQNATREDILTLAKAEVADDQGDGTLSNFYQIGDLEAGAENDKLAVVIFWEPNDNAVDNLYNVNNGQTVSDYAETGINALHIEFGINLQATQLVSEEDSFGPDYDVSASILPKATVNNTGVKTVPVYMGIDADELALDTSFQFLPNEDEGKAAVSEYKNWHADYVVVADRDVPANSMALAGWYKAWCGDNGWVVLTGDEVKAGNEVRLVAGLLSGTTVSYEEICQYGNDGEGFRCGATDLTGVNAGTTITVELRMYEVDETSSSLSTTDSETGYYEVIGRYTYTFGAYEVKTAEALQTAVTNGVPEIKLGANIDMGSEKLTVAKDVVLDLNGYTLSGVCNAGQSHLIMVNNGAALDVKDSSTAKSGKITYAKGSSDTGWAIDLEGELNLYSGTIELTGESWSIGYCVDVRPNAWGTNYTEDTVFHMYGGKIVSSDGAIRVASSSSDTYGNIVASFVMDGGEIDAAWDGIFVQQSDGAYDTLNVTINNGIVTSALSPIRVYGPAATSVIAGTEKPMTITVNGGSLVMNGTPDESRVWHTLGKIVIGGGMTLDQLNQYATITIA